MANFSNAQTAARNVWQRRNGLNFGGGLVSNKHYGLSVLPAMNPARAQLEFEPDFETYGEGYAECLTEVVPWPFAADDAGVAFDQANLYGVRTRVHRQLIEDGGGDKDWWTAVPKQLPSGYSAVGRCGLLEFADLIQDFIDGGTYLNHRTHTGLLHDATTAEGLARLSWLPMNRNQENYIFPPFVFMGIFSDDYRAIYLANTHVGFRGGKLTAWCGPASGGGSTRTLNLASQSVLADPWWTEGDPPGSLELHQTFEISADSTQEVAIDPLLPAANGIPHNFILYEEIGSGVFNCQFTFELSPRTDIPLPYFASQRNRCAPGGIILP